MRIFLNDFRIIQPLNLTVCDRYSRHLLNNHNHELDRVHINRQRHRNQLLLVFHDIQNDQIHMRSPLLYPILIWKFNRFTMFIFRKIFWNSIGMCQRDEEKNVKLLHLHRL